MVSRCVRVFGVLGAALACAKPGETPKPADATPAPHAEIGSWGFDDKGQKRSIHPGDDFDNFANGTWKDEFEIPADLSTYGVFIQLRLDAEKDIHAIVQELSSEEREAGSLEGKVGQAFGAWMDEEAINARGAEPLEPILEQIAAIEDVAGVAQQFSTVHQPAPYGIGVIPDPANTTRYIAYVGQAGLGLPDRDYYLKDDERLASYRKAYLAFIEKMFTLAGIEGGAEKAQAIMELETQIAEVHWSQADSRDIQKIYNPMSAEKLAELAPAFSMEKALVELGLASVPTFVVAQPSAIQASAELIAKTEIGLLKDYLTFHAIRSNATQLSTEFDDAFFEFYSKTLRGVSEKRDRWKRGVGFINGSLGEAVGKIYVERKFPPEAKAQMDALVANLISALEARLKTNRWMDDATRVEAQKKLSTFESRIGFPKKWTDYGPLVITDNNFDNARAVSEFQWKDQIRKLDGPVDREEWSYPPQTVNASYNPLLNQITFPAGILQPPFFDPNADPAVNYGAIGAVIGHEIGHGFDDQGRRFDEKGVIRDWWTEEADAAYTGLTDALGAQFAKYEPVPGVHINPKLTMGENIGDLGGLQMAYEAYHRYLDSCCDGEAPVVDGLSGDQRFFLGFAQVWRSEIREDGLRQRLLTDPHSPPRYRINGIVRNMDPWYNAFGVTEEHALYIPKDERVVIW
ncbi:MAG: M13 family metallopeptidase [Myxococcota bacterium]